MWRFFAFAAWTVMLCVSHAALVHTTIGGEPLSREALVEKSRKVLAQVDGELKLPGLHKPVEVLRDKWGIPHIYASDTHDLFYAQGVVAAQDRLFQIDLWRRTAT